MCYKEQMEKITFWTMGSLSYIDYKDFIKSKEGKCVPVSTPLPEGVISYTIEPEVFDCIEEGRQ